ncbi:MAG: tRNA-uridine aminocarboxypropyltransferase [Parashewanella sp.]
MSRSHCACCSFPSSHCLCAFAQNVAAQTHVVVLQHPSEVKHGKNSVRLLPLALDNLHIAIGETEADFTEIRHWLSLQKRPIFLLYPSDNSRDLSEIKSEQNAILVILDGTWRKAFKILQLNPWLLELTQVHISPNAPSRYQIRKANRSNSLSSLEATAFGIKSLEPSVDVAPLLHLFDAMIAQQLQAMPSDVRKRYE